MAILTTENAAFQWNGSAAEEVVNIDPGFAFEAPDTTDINATAPETTNTVLNPSITITMNRDASATVQNAMIADFAAKTARAWKYYENATKYWTATSTIADIKFPTAAKGVIQMVVTINATSDGTAPAYN